MMADCSIDVLCRVTAADMRCTYCSPSATRVLGWTPEDMEALFPKDLLHPSDAAEAIKAHARFVSQQDAELAMVSLRVRRKDGTYVLLKVSACLMRHPSTHEPWQVLFSLRDVSERMIRERELESLALTDALTGLSNRRAFDEALEREWRRARREQRELSLVLLDLDDFKSINDTHGHQAGDECLRRVASALTSIARRPGDIAARYGGEELALILPATGAAGAMLVAEQVRAAIEGLRFPDGSVGFVTTASIGVATAQKNASIGAAGPFHLLQTADRAMYQAKQNGRNRVETAILLPSDPR